MESLAKPMLLDEDCPTWHIQHASKMLAAFGVCSNQHGTTRYDSVGPQPTPQVAPGMAAASVPLPARAPTKTRPARCEASFPGGEVVPFRRGLQGC